MRRITYHRVTSRGCNSVIAMKIQRSVEKSNDITRACVQSDGISPMTAGFLSRVILGASLDLLLVKPTREIILGLCRRPGRQRNFIAILITHSRAMYGNLATMGNRFSCRHPIRRRNGRVRMLIIGYVFAIPMCRPSLRRPREQYQSEVSHEVQPGA